MDITHLQGQPALRAQLNLLQTLAEALQGLSHCQGAAVVGSLAGDRADGLSDVDLLVYCEAGHAADVLAVLSRVAQRAPVVHRLSGRHDENSVFEKVILEDWSSYEIHVIEPSTRMRLRSPFLCVLDRDNYLQSRVAEEKPIGRETAKPFVNGDAGLVWELFNCMKWLRRGELAFSRQYLQRLGLALGEPADA